MRRLAIEPNNLLRRCSPRFKLGGALVLVIGTTLLPPTVNLLYTFPAVLLFMLWILSRMPCFWALRRLLVAEAFIAGLGLLALFSTSARPVLVATLVKSNLCIITMLLLTWTTPFHEILLVLRRVHMPPVMLTMLALMYRYLPVIMDETKRMERARACRTFCRKRRFAWQNLSTIIGQLFIRSADRAERIYLAMCARGWK